MIKNRAQNNGHFQNPSSLASPISSFSSFFYFLCIHLPQNTSNTFIIQRQHSLTPSIRGTILFHLYKQKQQPNFILLHLYKEKQPNQFVHHLFSIQYANSLTQTQTILTSIIIRFTTEHNTNQSRE